MPETPRKKPLSFEDAISSSPLSVYIGRIVYMPSSWKENGLVYVDLNALDGDIKQPKSSEDKGKDMEHELESYGYRRAMLPRGLVMAANLWENPQTIYYKGSFAGNGSISISNYMFDPLTMTWITTVSTALNAIGIVNIPPIFVSLSETGIPAPATSVDVGQIVEESFSNALSSMTKPLEPGSNDSLIPSLDASDIIDKIKNSILSSLAIPIPGNSVQALLSDGVNLVSGLLPRLKEAYGFDELINKRDVLHEALTDAEKQIVQKINALQKTAEEQLKNLAASAVGVVQNQLKEIIMSVVSPLVNKVTALYNEAVGKIRDKILNVVNKKLKPPLRKVKKKLAKIVSQAISPIIAKLPMPARFMASIVVKKVLEKVCDKIVGFVVKAVKEALKKAFDYGKDKIIELLMKAFEPLKEKIMQSFVGRTAKQLVSKTQWLLNTDAGDVVKALPGMLVEQFKPMDDVYETIEERMTPSTSEMTSVNSILNEFLNSVYEGCTVTSKPDEGTELWDGIRGRRVSLYDIKDSPYLKKSSTVTPATQKVYSRISNDFAAWLQKKMIPIVSYADALNNPTAKPSELVSKTLEKLPQTLIVQSSDRDEIVGQILEATIQGIEDSTKYARTVDDGILNYICSIIGIQPDSIKYTYIDKYNMTLPEIDINNDFFPKWKTESHYYSGKTSHGSYLTYISEIGTYSEQETSKMGSLINYARWYFCAYVNEMLASLHVLIKGGVLYEQQTNGSYTPKALTDMSGNEFYCYKHSNSGYIRVDRPTGIVFQVCPAFVIDIREIQAEKKKKSVKTTQETKLKEVSVFKAQNLVSEEYLEKHPEMKGKVITLNAEQAALLTNWLVFVFDTSKYPYKKPAGIPSGRLQVKVSIGDVDKDPNGLKFSHSDTEFTMNMRKYVEMENPLIMQKNSFFTVNGLRYIYPMTTSNMELPILLYEVNRGVGTDKNGNVEEFTFWNTVYEPELDEDNNPVVDDSGNQVFSEREQLNTVASKDVTVTCDQILWYEDEGASPVDVSTFFFLTQPIKTEGTDTGIGIFTRTGEDGSQVAIRYNKKKDGDMMSYTKDFNIEVHTNACKELMFISIDPKNDKIQDRARLKKNAVPNSIIPMHVYRDNISTIVKKEHDANTETESSSADNFEQILENMKKAKQVVTETIPNAIDKAFDVVDFDALKHIEPLLSDAEQKVMDKLTAFMEDAKADISEFASEFNDIVKNIMGGLGELVGKTIDLKALTEKIMTLLGATKGVNEVISTLNKLGDVATKVNDTFEAASGTLDSSLVSELGAMVGPSMSLSNSIGEYDMSLTEKPKSLKPYCHDIDDDVLLKVGDLVLLMAIGNSTEHLYVLDIPYNNQIV